MKKILLVALCLVLIVSAVVYLLFFRAKQDELAKPGTAEDKKKIEQNIGKLLAEKPDFEKIISDELKKRESAGNTQLLEKSQANFKTKSIKYRIENLQLTENSASCTAVTERILENSKTGFKVKLIERNFITLSKIEGQWKVAGVKALSADSEILDKGN